MSKVFVIDTNKQTLNPVRPGRARILLSQGKAAVWRRFPFTIILKEAVAHPTLQPLRIRLDPGSKTTSITILNDTTGETAFTADLIHRGYAIKKALEKRREVRRKRRQWKTRYRQCRYNNRKRRSGWLPPSLESRVANILTWIKRLRRVCPIGSVSLEMATDNTQVSTKARNALFERLLKIRVPLQNTIATQSTPESRNRLVIEAKGHGRRRKHNIDEHGFPRGKPKGAKKIKGFQTGDLVQAVVPGGKKQGIYVGRAAVRANGAFTIITKTERISDINYRCFTIIHRCDGYSYRWESVDKSRGVSVAYTL